MTVRSNILNMMPNDPKDRTKEKVFNPEVLQGMKRSGLPKPQDVPWSQWLAPKKLKHRYRLIAYMAASGLNNTQIAEQIGIKPTRVNVILSSQRVKLEIKRVQAEIFIKDPQKRFMQILPKAIETAEGVMDNDLVKPSIRADVAFKFMDRALGKPKETHEVKTSSIRELFEKLEEIEKRKAIPVEYQDAEIVEAKPDEPRDQIDDWIKKNFD
jgi:hypothetical protein